MINRNLKSYLKRENRAPWLNKIVDTNVVLGVSVSFLIVLWLMCYVSYLYDYLPYSTVIYYISGP